LTSRIKTSRKLVEMPKLGKLVEAPELGKLVEMPKLHYKYLL
jgi:hypothetical protein